MGLRAARPNEYWHIDVTIIKSSSPRALKLERRNEILLALVGLLLMLVRPSGIPLDSDRLTKGASMGKVLDAMAVPHLPGRRSAVPS